MKRLLNVSELAEYLGVSLEYLRQWRREIDFPKPIRGKLWDFKAVEQYLDKLSKINTESGWNKALSEGLKNGDNHRALS